MTEFKDSKWSKNKAIDKLPDGSHFQAVVFVTRSISNPGYDPRDPRYGESYRSEQGVDLYAFTSSLELENFVTDVSRSSSKFAFYHVPRLGSMKVEIDTGAPKQQHRQPDSFDLR